MRRLCRQIVWWFGASWGRFGWVAFCCWLWLPGIFARAGFCPTLVRVLDSFLLTWWFVDAMDRRKSIRVINVCGFLILACLIPPFHLPVIILWLIYWVYLRD